VTDDSHERRRPREGETGRPGDGEAVTTVGCDDSSIPRERTALRRILMRGGSILLGLLGALLLTEIGLRVASVQVPRMQTKRILLNDADPSVQYHCYPSNPHGEFEPLPDLSEGAWRLGTYTFDPVELPLERLAETPWCIRYDFSSKLIRDREYPPQPPPGVARIVMIGDSFVFGEGVPLERTLPRQVESLLNRTGDRGGSAAAGYEVINGGVVGADTAQEVETLRQIAEEANCTRAIVVFIPNDISLTRRLLDRQKYINDLIVLRDSYLDEHEAGKWYAGHFRTLHVLGSHLEMGRIHRETIQWYRDSYDPRHNGPNLRALARELEMLAETPDCRVAFVLYPLLEGFERRYPLGAIHEQVAGMARAAGLPVLDLGPVFYGMPTGSLWVHPADRHPNGRAHELAAEAIFEWLWHEVPGFLSEEASE
jgi:hypothetical protein